MKPSAAVSANHRLLGLFAFLFFQLSVRADFTDGYYFYRGPYTVGTAPISLIATAQRCEQWCWAACAETVTRAQGFCVPQEEMVRRLYGGLTCAPAYIHDVARVMNAVYPTREGGFTRVRAQATYGAPRTAAGMLSYLQKGQPFIMQVGSHDMVFYSAEVYDVYDFWGSIYYGPTVTRLFYQDPFYSWAPFPPKFNELPINPYTLSQIVGYITVSTEPVYGVRILEQSSSQTVEYGKTVVLRARADGTPPLQYQWFRNGQRIGGNRSSLTIKRAKPHMDGDYYCRVSNAFSSDTTTMATLRVVERPPAVKRQPVSKTAKAGRSTVFTVTCSSHLPITYQWYFNSQPIAGATKKSLTLKNLTVANMGTYHVVASNVIGSTQSESVMLTVVP